ncbi:deoxynucleoside kinase [bacterium]|nr:deoxynucleoside kinase [bacterium]
MYLLEGNLGAGKSTMLALIKQHLPHLHVVTEPVNSWHNDNFQESLLGHFYKDTPRWAYTMELFTMMTRVKEHLKEQASLEQLNSYTYTPKIMERSLYSGYYCFAKNGYEQGFLTYEEWTAYNQWFEFLVAKKCATPTGFIYLQAAPEVCLKRMSKRNRSGEDTVPLEYLQQIHNQHEQFLVHKTSVAKNLQNVPVLVLDVSEEFAHNQVILQNLINQIQDFIMSSMSSTLINAVSLNNPLSPSNTKNFSIV